MTEDPAVMSAVTSPWRTALLSGLRVATLCAFCASQIWLDRLASRPIYLATLSIDLLLAFALAVGVLAPAAVGLAQSLVARLLPRGTDLIERVFAGLFIGSVGAIVWRKIPGIGWEAHLVASLLTAVAAGWLYGRGTLPRRLASTASPAIVLFPLWFLWTAAGPLFREVKTTAEGPTARQPRNIVWIVLDECCGVSLMNANRELNPHRVPHIARLADEWTWFRNGSSVHPRTDQAVPALLTGRYPSVDRPPRAADHPGNLFELLRKTGQYDIVAFEPFTQIANDVAPERIETTPAPLIMRLAETLSVMATVWSHDLLPDMNPFDVPPFPNEWFGAGIQSRMSRDVRTGTIRYAWDVQRREQVEHYIECLLPRERPTLYFLHIALPHYPWLYRPSGKQTAEDVGIQSHSIIGGNGIHGELWTTDVGTVDRNYQAYLAQLGYADLVVGEIVDRLKEVGLYDDCLFVLTGDHGVSFRQGHERRTADGSTLADVMSVPMFVKRPGQVDRIVDDRNAETIDLLPTVLTQIGLEGGVNRDGADLFDAERPDRPIKRFRQEGAGFHEIPATFEGRWECLADLLGRMGDGSKPVGTRSALRGREIAEFVMTECPSLFCSVNSPKNFDYEPAGNRIPGWFDGSLRGDREEIARSTFALAVNGKIIEVGSAAADYSFDVRFGAFVPEQALVAGVNRFELFLVEPSPTRLQKIRFTDHFGNVVKLPWGDQSRP
jgi:hypothetical protein